MELILIITSPSLDPCTIYYYTIKYGRHKALLVIKTMVKTRIYAHYKIPYSRSDG